MALIAGLFCIGIFHEVKTMLEKFDCEDCGFSATLNLGLKRLETSLHNLGVRKYSNMKLVPILQQKIMKREYIVEC